MLWEYTSSLNTITKITGLNIVRAGARYFEVRLLL